MIQRSELILNKDGSIFHLHLKPEDVANRIILAGDPDRVEIIAGFLEKVEFSVQNREFRSVTGWYRGEKFTIISTGIGADNIDIVINELDALVNIDFKKREIKKEKKSLEIVRIGTSGGLQKELPVNSYLVSEKAIGFDGLLNFYAGRDKICDLAFENAFKQFTGWNNTLSSPYVVNASEYLASLFSGPDFIKGVTATSPGFYGPQGRKLRLKPAMPDFNKKIEKFRYNEKKITNFEMETSAIYGLSKQLGHNALTVCLIIVNRITGEANENYHPEMKKLIQKVLNNLTYKR
jgi:uridine phosphorylase